MNPYSEFQSCCRSREEHEAHILRDTLDPAGCWIKGEAVRKEEPATLKDVVAQLAEVCRWLELISEKLEAPFRL